jgi:phospholipase D1/2
MKCNLVMRMKGVESTKGFPLPFEDHRATATMHTSVTLSSSSNTALV